MGTRDAVQMVQHSCHGFCLTLTPRILGERMKMNQRIYRIARDASGPVHLSDLADMLGYDSSRGVAKRVSSAYWWYYNNGDKAAAAEIARTFVDRNGNYAWWL